MHAATTNDRRRRRSGRFGIGAGLVLGGLAVSLSGCVSPQVVPISVEPAPVEVYVDGELAAGRPPESLSLRPDRSHVVLVRRAGYVTQQIVLESVREDGAPRLAPARISLRLVPEQRPGRRLEVELDPADDVPEPR